MGKGELVRDETREVARQKVCEKTALTELEPFKINTLSSEQSEDEWWENVDACKYQEIIIIKKNH